MSRLRDLTPFAFSSGPRNAQVAIVGEAWGEQEERLGEPFVGQSGQELTRMLSEAGIARRECFITNTLALRPPGNNIEALCVGKKELPLDYRRPHIKQGKYIPPEFLPEVERLRQELAAVGPNLVIALGNTACWALLDSVKISQIRGTVTRCILVPGLKVLPTYHPAAVLRNWSLRVIAVADFMKAAREAKFPEIRRPEREVLINPTLEELKAWAAVPAMRLACDIETASKMITCIGFARSPSEAIVIPFVDPDHPDHSYWPTAAVELEAWAVVRQLLEGPAEKIFQSGLYDLQYIARMGIRPKNCIHDTMLLHHSLYPELQKGLGFLGSIYTNEASWKLLRNNDTLKKDE